MKKSYLYGIHPVETLLKTNPKDIVEIFIQEKRKDKRIQEIIELSKKHYISPRFILVDQLQKLVGDVVHQGVVAQICEAKIYSEDDLTDLLANLSTPPFLLILDGIQDPHNLGACLRTADAAGVNAVIVPKDNSVGLTSVVRKVASGAAESVPFIQITNLARTMRKLKEKGIWLFGATEEADVCIYDTDLSGAIAIVMGAEGKGLRHLTKEHCDFLFHIPMHGLVSSLNVSVATGVALFEVVRRKISRR